MDRQPSISTSERALRPGLLLAGAGALLLLVNLFGTPGRLIAVAAMISGALIAAPQATPVQRSAGWWTALAAGTLLALTGVAVGFAVESLGGLLSVAGGVLVAAAVVFGLPAR